MKKIYTLVTIVFVWVLMASKVIAVPAYPKPIEYKLPDGTTIAITMKGDEKVRWAETKDGYSILLNKDGFYEYAMLNDKGDMVRSGIRVTPLDDNILSTKSFLSGINKGLVFSSSQVNIMKQVWEIQSKEASKAFPTTGSRDLICILIGYTDLAFTKNQTEFNDLFNYVGYTTGGATGSVKDFYLENSYNQFDLTVDVAGPYTASNTMAYYGTNTPSDDYRVRDLVLEAINLADPDVNYANYDNDNDGSVDALYIIYAGYGEEAGGGSNPNAIWAHAWSLASAVTRDGKTLQRYSCSAELRGNSGTNITNIGVICHEFGHVLGAPDYYDTDYEDGGQYEGTDTWDMMAGGSWNNGGATPAHHNGFTKVVYYNWAPVTELTEGTTITLNNAAQHSNSFYKINTTTTGEYYFLENREKHLFDAYIPGSGMIIYHVHSGVFSVGNAINATHPQRMYPVAQNATSAIPTSTVSTYGTIDAATCAWTGTGKTEFTDASTPSMKSWAAANTSKPITNISRNATNKTVTFDFMGGAQGNPTNFAAVSTSASQINLSWLLNSNNNPVVLAFSATGTFGTPVNGTSYSAGNSIPGGGTVLYSGSNLSYQHLSLNANTTYYYKIWSVMAGTTYSPGADKSAATWCNAIATLPLNENFDASTSLPGCWSIVDNQGNGQVWQFGTHTSGLTGSTGNYAYLNSDVLGSGNTQNTDLVSPLLDLTNYTNVTLGFKHYYKHYSSSIATLSYSIDGGTNWTQIQQWNALTANPATFSQEIAALAGKSAVKFKWNYVGTWAYFWDIDDISITGTTITNYPEPTDHPTTITAGTATSNSITVTWTDATSKAQAPTGYLVKASAVGYADIANPLDGTPEADATLVKNVAQGIQSATFTGLSPATTYYVKIFPYTNSGANINYKTDGSVPQVSKATEGASCTYCTPTATSDDATGITYVEFNTLTNASVGDPAYTDNTSMTTTVLKGQSYPLSVRVNTAGAYTVNTLAWIDWDENCTFDESEKYDLGSATNQTDGATSLSPLSILIPGGTANGSYTMRIRTRWNSAPTACNNNDYSEAEDYTIIVSETTQQYTLTINFTGNGTVNVDGAEYTDPITVDENTVLNLEALAESGWQFDSWTGEVANTAEASTTITMDADKTITATFTEIPSGLLFVENFDYTVGTTLVSNGWTAHSGANTNSSVVVTPGLGFIGYLSSNEGLAAGLANTGEDVNHTFPQQTSGNIYAAFLVKTESSNAAGYFLHLGQSTIGSTYFTRIWVNATGDGIGLSDNTAPVSYKAITPGVPTLVVAKLNYATKQSSLYVLDRFSSTEPGVPDATFTETASYSNVGSIALRQYNGAQRVVVDGIRVATNWAEAVAEGPKVTVNFSVAGSNGSIAATVFGSAIASGDGVFEGEEVIFTATPDAGYRVKEWTLNGSVVPDNTTTSFTISNLSAESTVTVEFEAIPTYVVNFSVTGVNGNLAATVDAASITSGDAIEEQKTVVFTATPDAGYRVKEWTLNGSVVADNTTNTYTLSGLNAAATVTVEFEMVTYAVNFSVVGLNGSLTATVDAAPITSGDAVQESKTVVFTATPDGGYRVKEWTLNGSVIVDNTTNTYTHSNLGADATVTVEFEIIPTYAVTFSVIGSNGTVAATVDGMAITSGDVVEEGKEVIFTATPDVFYAVTEWQVNSETVIGNTTNTLSLGSLSEATSVTVSFEFQTVGSVTATYTSGDLSSDRDFTALPGQSSCPGLLTVTIPQNAYITGVDVEYTMTSQNFAWMIEQVSQLRCVSEAGESEAEVSRGEGSTEGTYSYSRQNLSIADFVTGGGDIQFEIHAGRQWGGSGCGINYTRIVNNTWSVTVHYQMEAPTQFTLTMLQPEGLGSVNPVAGDYTFQENRVTSVSATPAIGWVFDSWVGGVAEPTEPTTSVLMDGNKSLHAVFTQNIVDSITLPYVMSFDGVAVGNIPEGWFRTQGHWGVSSTNNANGTIPEMFFSRAPHETGEFKLVTPKLHALPAQNIEISFKYSATKWDAEGVTHVALQSSLDGLNWSEEWTVTIANNIGYTTANVDISHLAGQDFYLAWNYVGYTYYNDWNLDDIFVRVQPSITAEATAISYGQTLASSIVSGTAMYGETVVEGTFAFEDTNIAPVAGIYTANVTFTPTNATQYLPVTATVDVTVTKAEAAIVLSDLSFTYDGMAKQATATTTPEGLTVEITYNEEVELPLNAGNYTVLATVVDDNYFGTATETLTIQKAAASVSLSNLVHTYDGTAKSASATTIPEGLTVNFTYDGLAELPVNSGDYEILATINDTNYEGFAEGTLTINKATATVTLSGLSHIYDGTAKAATATTTPEGLNVEFTYNGSPTQPVTVGAYDVVAMIVENNYSGSATGTLNITKATATITLANLEQTYDGTEKSVSATTVPEGLTVNITYNGSAALPVNAAVYEVIAMISDTNYGGSKTGSLTINKAVADIEISNLAHVYSGEAKEATVTTTPEGLTVDITYNESSEAPVNAGEYTVVATVNEENYQGTESATMVVDKAAATVLISNLSHVYDGTAKAVSVTTEPEGLTVEVTYINEVEAPVNAGSYAVLASIVDQNYQGSAAETMVIEKAAATIHLSSLSHVYDGTAKVALATTTPEGLAVDISYNGLAMWPVNAGDYAVVATVVDNNYTATVEDILVIEKAVADIEISGLVYTYDGLSKSVTVNTIPDGLNVDVTYNESAIEPINAGEYAVVASINEINYEGNATETLIINPATLTITANSFNKMLGQEFVFAGTEFTTTEMVGSDNVVSVTIVSEGAAAGATMAEYPIVISDAVGSGLSNYTIEYLNGVMTVTDKIILTLEGLVVENKVYDNTNTATVTNWGTLVGIEGEDVVTLNTANYVAIFSNERVGTSKVVSISGLVLEGADANKYRINNQTATADITPRTLVLSAFAVANKVYDGTTATQNLAFEDDRIEGDILTLDMDAAFEDKNAGVDKTVSFFNIEITGGIDALNYALASTEGTAQATIFVRDISVGGSFTVLDKIVDENTTATIDQNNLTLVNYIDGDDVALVDVEAAFVSPDIAENIAVSITNADLSGTDAPNYALTLAGAPTTTASILPVPTYELMLSANPSDIGAEITGAGVFEEATEITISASAVVGYTFAGWSGSAEDIALLANANAATTTLLMPARAVEFVANYTLNQHNVAVTVTPELSGTVTGAGMYDYNAEVTLTATPNAGFEFLNWRQNGSVFSNENPLTFNMPDEDVALTAFFVVEGTESFNVTLSAMPANGGTVSGAGEYAVGEEVVASAAINPGYTFVNWTNEASEIVSTDVAYTFTMPAADVALTANFELVNYNVTAMVNPENAGTVSGAGVFNMGNEVSLTATANAGYAFVNWTNEANEIMTVDAAYTFTMPAADVALTANFELVDYNVTATVNPENAGTVSGAGVFNMDNEVTLTATANAGYAFVNWTNAANEIVSVDAAYTFTMPAADVALTANFEMVDYNVTATVNPENAGTVSGAGVFNMGNEVSLTATANAGYAFVNWTNAANEILSVDAAYTFTMPAADVALTANFELVNYNVTATINPENAGTVSGAGVFNMGNEVTLTATANAGYAFVNWTNAASEIVSVDAAYTFTMPAADVALTANFELVDYNVTATVNPENAGTVSGAGVFNMGNEVTLTATANAGYAFVNWTNAASEIVSVDAAYTFTMPAADVALNANFREKISATINPTTGTFDENSPENLSTVITWNDAASVTAITIVVEGETVELIANEDYTITDIDGLTAELTFLMGAKYAPATKGEMDIPCTIAFDYGTNAVYTIHYIFVDFWNVAFHVTSLGSPVANATISIAGEELTTDDNGQAMTELENGVYAYTITKDGYVTYQGFVTVSDEDAEVNVELVSGIDETGVTLTKLYPNPAFDVVTLQRNTTEQATLEVYTNSGALVETLTWNTQTLQLNVAGYKNGVFHIRILGTSVENLRFIKQ